jgi:hypothetical protein
MARRETPGTPILATPKTARISVMGAVATTCTGTRQYFSQRVSLAMLVILEMFKMKQLPTTPILEGRREYQSPKHAATPSQQKSSST